MISKLIVYETLAALIGWIDPSFMKVNPDTGVSGFTAAFGSNPFAKGHAAGGYTANVGTNQIAGVVHGGEWVATADQTAKYRPLFDMIMNGTLDQAIAQPSVIPRATQAAQSSTYAAQVGTIQGAAPQQTVVNVINSSGQPSKQTQRTSGGVTITDIVVGSVAKNIASGGQIAQTIQNTYGVSRNGVRRGSR